MVNRHFGSHRVRFSQSIVALGIVEFVWAITAVSIAILFFEWFFA